MTTTMKDRDEREPVQAPDAYDDYAPRTAPWWTPWLVALAVAAVVIGVGSYLVYGRGVFVPSMMGGEHTVPPVAGYYNGEEIHFIHTEASDPAVATMLSGMMDSPVPTVASLAEVPDSALRPVFVFKNGVKPDGDRGPFGYQPDVFDSVPGDEAYTPLRAINVVTWNDSAQARVLRSAKEVAEAEAAGEITIVRPNVVVDMPIVSWPNGGR